MKAHLKRRAAAEPTASSSRSSDVDADDGVDQPHFGPSSDQGGELHARRCTNQRKRRPSIERWICSLKNATREARYTPPVRRDTSSVRVRARAIAEAATKSLTHRQTTSEHAITPPSGPCVLYATQLASTFRRSPRRVARRLHRDLHPYSPFPSALGLVVPPSDTHVARPAPPGLG